jgi:hypothetical protein
LISKVHLDFQYIRWQKIFLLHVRKFAAKIFCPEDILNASTRSELRGASCEDWKSALKADFHFNRIVTYRSIFFCIEVISSTLVSLVLMKQRNTLRFGTSTVSVEVENGL